MMKTINTPHAPAAIGPYSQAKVVNGLVFVSGCIPLDPQTNTMVGDTIECQAKQAIENLKAILEASGSDLDHVVKTTCFLTDMANFNAFNTVYATYFTEKPARSCFAVVALPKAALVEIEAVAEVIGQ